MATAISMREWVETLTYFGDDISIDVRIVDIGPSSITLQPMFVIGDTVLWKGNKDVIPVGGALSLTGFVLRDNDLVLEDFGGKI